MQEHDAGRAGEFAGGGREAGIRDDRRHIAGPVQGRRRDLLHRRIADRTRVALALHDEAHARLLGDDIATLIAARPGRPGVPARLAETFGAVSLVGDPVLRRIDLVRQRVRAGDPLDDRLHRVEMRLDVVGETALLDDRENGALHEVGALAQPPILDGVAVGVDEAFLPASQRQRRGVTPSDAAHERAEPARAVEAMKQDGKTGHRRAGKSRRSVAEHGTSSKDDRPEQARGSGRPAGHHNSRERPGPGPVFAGTVPFNALPDF